LRNQPRGQGNGDCRIHHIGFRNQLRPCSYTLGAEVIGQSITCLSHGMAKGVGSVLAQPS
jgi:hypothetical protein